MSSSPSTFQLSRSYTTDTSPIRCMSHYSNDDDSSSLLLTGSESAIVSSINLLSHETIPDPSGKTQHGHHVTSITVDNKVYVTGSKDHKIRIFDVNTHELLKVLEGHEKPVTSLDIMHFDQEQVVLVSGSWDGTAKLWNMQTGTCLTTLHNHENTVSVCALPTVTSTSTPSMTGIGGGQNSNMMMARLATGSAGIATGNQIIDHKIRIWDVQLEIIDKDNVKLNATLQHTVANDHDGPIRSLTYDTDNHTLLSCSNDGTVKIRDPINGHCVSTLCYHVQQQPPMLLDVTTTNTHVIACGEDGTVIVWPKEQQTQNQLPQVILHPNCVWKVLSINNQDFSTACHDGYIRIFTSDPQKVASQTEITSFEQAVQSSIEAKSSGPTTQEIEKLPKWEMNHSLNGKKEGSVQVFSKNGKAIAAQWSDVSQTWIEVGEVTGQPIDSTSSSGLGHGQGRHAGVINGVSYDFVFPIEIDTPSGEIQTLQIGYNNGENPFVTAQQFIDEHTLDQNYLSQIADYIRNRVGNEGNVPTIGLEDGTTTTPSSSTAEPMDYTPTVSSTKYQHLPMAGYKSFENGTDMKTLSKIASKITEFNLTILNNINLSSNEIDITLQNLCMTLSATNRYHASSISKSELDVIMKMIQHWSMEHVFPAFDIARLLVLHPDASSSSKIEFWNVVIGVALEKCNELNQQMDVGTGGGVHKVALPMLSFRLFANCIKGGKGSQTAVETNFASIIKCVDSFTPSGNKNIRLAASTVLLNMSSYLKSKKSMNNEETYNITEIPQLFLTVVSKILSSSSYETEAIVRTLVALGTVLLVDEVFVRKAKELMIASIAQSTASQHGSKAIEIGNEIQSILS